MNVGNTKVTKYNISAKKSATLIVESSDSLRGVNYRWPFKESYPDSPEPSQKSLNYKSFWCYYWIVYRGVSRNVCGVRTSEKIGWEGMIDPQEHISIGTWSVLWSTWFIFLILYIFILFSFSIFQLCCVCPWLCINPRLTRGVLLQPPLEFFYLFIKTKKKLTPDF